jgi:hypothetical protein
MCYIKRTLKYIFFENGQVSHRYSSADWVGDKNIRHFTLGYCFILAKGVISRGSKKQIVFSSTKSEYITLVKATTKIIWPWKLLV